MSISIRLSANRRVLYVYVNHVLTEQKHNHKKKAYVDVYVAAVPTSA